MAHLLLEFTLIGLVGGLLGIFYRNCLKVENMIFHPVYNILKAWTRRGKRINSNIMDKTLSFIAYPLGYCIYCSTPWITLILCTMYLSSWSILPQWQDIVIGIVTALGIQHIVVASACRWLINNHPDLDM